MKTNRRNWLLGVAGAAIGTLAANRRSAAGDWTARKFAHPADRVRPVISDLCFDPSSGRLASAGDDHLIRVWDVPTGRLAAELRGHRDWVRCVARSGDVLLSGSNDRTIRRWNWTAREAESHVIWRGASAVVGMAASPDGKWFAACCFNGEVHWFSTADWQAMGQIDCRHSDLRCVTFSPNSQTLVATGRDGVLHVADLADGRVQQEIATRHRRRRDVLFLDEHRVLSVGDDGFACWLTLDHPSECHDLRCEQGRIFSVARLDGQRIATAGSDNLIHVWNLELQRQEAALAGHQGTVTSMVWTGTELISAGYDTTIRAWKPSTPVAATRATILHR